MLRLGINTLSLFTVFACLLALTSAKALAQIPLQKTGFIKVPSTQIAPALLQSEDGRLSYLVGTQGDGNGHYKVFVVDNNGVKITEADFEFKFLEYPTALSPYKPFISKYGNIIAMFRVKAPASRKLTPQEQEDARKTVVCSLPTSPGASISMCGKLAANYKFAPNVSYELLDSSSWRGKDYIAFSTRFFSYEDRYNSKNHIDIFDVTPPKDPWMRNWLIQPNGHITEHGDYFSGNFIQNDDDENMIFSFFRSNQQGIGIWNTQKKHAQRIEANNWNLNERKKISIAGKPYFLFQDPGALCPTDALKQKNLDSCLFFHSRYSKYQTQNLSFHEPNFFSYYSEEGHFTIRELVDGELNTVIENLPQLGDGESFEMMQVARGKNGKVYAAVKSFYKEGDKDYIATAVINAKEEIIHFVKRDIREADGIDNCRTLLYPHNDELLVIDYIKGYWEENTDKADLPSVLVGRIDNGKYKNLATHHLLLNSVVRSKAGDPIGVVRYAYDLGYNGEYTTTEDVRFYNLLTYKMISIKNARPYEAEKRPWADKHIILSLGIPSPYSRFDAYAEYLLSPF